MQLVQTLENICENNLPCCFGSTRDKEADYPQISAKENIAAGK